MIEAARSVLNRYIPDIYLYSDVYKGEESGKWAFSTLLTGFRLMVSIDLQDMHCPLLPNPRRPLFIVQKLFLSLAWPRRTSLFKPHDLYWTR
jgi:RNA 3'-terminal phosphate cyclase (RTC), insert domain